MKSLPRLLASWAFGLCFVGLCLVGPSTSSAQDPQQVNPFAVPDPVSNEPTVEAVVASDPQTAPELMRAIAVLLDVDRNDLAKTYVEKLNALDLTDPQLFELYRTAGPDAVFRLAIPPEIQPLGSEVSRRILAGAERHATDSTRLSELVESVLDDDRYKPILCFGGLATVGRRGCGGIDQLAG